MRLSPLDPLGYMFTGVLALAHFSAGRYEDAIEWAERSLREQPRYMAALSTKGASCAHLGRIEEARDCLRQRLELQPGLTIAKYKPVVRFLAPEIRALYVDGLRKAGLPE
jgi:adenylate cyclase